MKTVGAEIVPESGPLLLVPNHDSQWDPVVVAVALRKRRKLRFLARANLWKIPGLGPILYGIGQIPIERGAGDAGALDEAAVALRDGAAICVFPEGKLSGGQRLRGRVAASVGSLVGARRPPWSSARWRERPTTSVSRGAHGSGSVFLNQPTASHGPMRNRGSWPNGYSMK